MVDPSNLRVDATQSEIEQADTAPQSVDDPRVIDRIQKYLVAIEEGNNPDRDELLREFPQIANELTACLDGLEFVNRATKPFRDGHVNGITGADGTADLCAVGILGDFRVLREIGRGGMGVVYEAEQISLKRRVALKVLPFAAVMDQRQLQRFKNEAQAAA